MKGKMMMLILPVLTCTVVVAQDHKAIQLVDNGIQKSGRLLLRDTQGKGNWLHALRK